jgi:thienamycin biosynthesis protein ThnN
MTSALSPVSDGYARQIAGIHLHPDSGTPYWLERDRRLGAAALSEVRSFADLRRLVGFRDAEERRAYESDTRFQPLERFVPASVLESGCRLWAAQTGGTTGAPKHGTWGERYWSAILDFSDEFLDLHGVPRGVNWLFVGPMGPHTTGRLVVSIAEVRGGRCFSIDLDPRIVKIFGSEGRADAHERYVQHIFDQVAAVIRYQRIGVLFCTSRLLEAMPEYLDIGLFSHVQAIVHAGTTMERETDRILREEIFPRRPLVGIYGTSTTGISYQKPPGPEDDSRVVYVPSSPYILLDVVEESGRKVAFGEEGWVSTYRLTEDALVPGFWERDRAVRTEPYGEFAARWGWDWIADPYSPEFTENGSFEGVY